MASGKAVMAKIEAKTAGNIQSKSIAFSFLLVICYFVSE